MSLTLDPATPVTSLAELDGKLREFESLPDDWDSYGGKAISPAVTARAREIWEQLRPVSAFVCPGGDGLVEISLFKDKKRLSITVEDPPDAAEDCYALYSTDTHDIEELAVIDIPRLKQLIAEMGPATI